MLPTNAKESPSKHHADAKNTLPHLLHLPHMSLSRKPSEKKHSTNPLKFFKTSSSHPEDVAVSEDKKQKKHHFGLRSRSNTVRHDDASSISSSSSNNGLADIKRGHMANPFIKSTTFDVLGTGADIAAPRNATVSHGGVSGVGGGVGGGLSRTPSLNHASNNNHNKLVYNPYGMNSRTPSTYSLTTPSSDDEKKHILTNPIRDPNEMLPYELKQDFHSLSDAFVFPEKSRKKLGDGASATVFLVQHKKTFKNYALKKFILLPHETDEQFYKRAAKEFIIAKKLSHNKHIVTTFYCLKIQTTTNISRGWGFILDYCQGGDLFNLIARSGWKSHPIAEKYCIFKQLVYAVQFIHSKGIAHRDLKPENILIDSYGLVKLTDFGIAEYTHEIPSDLDSPLKKFTSFVGSPPYIPPELMKIQKDHTGEYDPYKLDLWSVGVILFVLIYQNAPFRSASPSDQLYRDFVTSYKTYIAANPSFRFGDVNHGPGIEFKYAKEFHSTGASRVAWRLCDYDEEFRYTMKDILKDPWFVSLECCCSDEEDEEEDSLFMRHSSFDSIPSPVHAPPAPVAPIKPTKSMLDFTTVETTAAANNNNNNPPFCDGTIPNHSEPMLATTSQAGLPPVVEDGNESESLSESPVGVSKASMCDSIHSNIFKPAVSAIQSPEPQYSSTFDSALNLESLKIDTADDNSKDHIKPTTPSTPAVVSPPASNNIPTTTDDETSLATPKQVASPAKFDRASSFSSIMSNRSGGRSVRSNSSVASDNAATGGGTLSKRKVRHHHLDVSNVSNHASTKR
jgi:serine/threonine protein kinase